MIEERINTAIAQVGDWLQTFSNVSPLNDAERERYSCRGIREAWSFDFQKDFGDDGQLRLLLPSSFPFALPLVAVDRSFYLKWPHVEVDGVLCAFPNAATHSPYDPVALVQYTLQAAIDLISACRAGLLEQDFQREFHSYWSRESSEDNRDVISLLSDIDSTRLVSAWFGQEFIVIGTNKQEIRNWLDHRYPGNNRKLEYESALAIALQTPLLPGEYPRSAGDILGTIRTKAPDAERILLSLITSSPRPLILLTAPTDNGPALAAMKISTIPARDFRGRRLDKSRNGFRPDKVPPALATSRILSQAREPNRYVVRRADPAWIHGRGKDLTAQRLFEKKVVLLGAGSIGSFVAEILAQAGVGKLTIVDPEKLTFSNAGRHLLGVDSEGLHKATAIATLLQKRFPHHSIVGDISTAERYLDENKTALNEIDLVISVTGDWGANAYLNELFLSGHMKQTPVLVGWSEAHAVAGHAVFLNSRTSCLLCGFTEKGEPLLKVATWPEVTLLSEPACGGLYQPYGPAEIASINAMIAGMALEALCGKLNSDEHRVYAVDEDTIRELNGALVPEWLKLTNGIPRNARVTIRLPWSQRADCPLHGGS